MHTHAIATEAVDTWAGWRLIARTRIDDRDVEHSRPAAADLPTETDHAHVARDLAAIHELAGVWHGAPLAEGWVFVVTDGPNGDFALGEDWEDYDPPGAPWRG